MKKGLFQILTLLVLLLLFVCVLVACQEDFPEATETTTETTGTKENTIRNPSPINRTTIEITDKEGEVMQVLYTTGIYYDKNWEETMGTCMRNAIPDEETAIAVATAVLEGLQRDGLFLEYTLSSLFYDTDDAVWIVSFGLKPTDEGAVVVGGDFNVAIQKENGQILRMWSGE